MIFKKMLTLQNDHLVADWTGNCFIHKEHFKHFCGGARGVMVIIVGNGHEFKTWTRLIAFHIALIPLGKA